MEPSTQPTPPSRTRTNPVDRRRQQEGSSTTQVGYRISGLTKFEMISVALFLDALPILTILGLAVFVVMEMGGSGTAQACSEAEGVGWFEALFGILTPSGWSTARCVGGVLFGALSGLTTALVIGPMVYALTAFVALILAVLIFFTWFSFKKVPYFSTKNGRMGSFFFAWFIELLPFTNWLPGITYLTWKQIQVSRKEDTAQVQTKV